MVVFRFADGENGFENMIKGYGFWLFLSYCFIVASLLYHAERHFQKPRLGNQLGSESALSYAILY